MHPVDFSLQKFQMHSSLFVLLFQETGYAKKIILDFFYNPSQRKNDKKDNIFVYFNGFFTTKFH